jgi:Do/DeqQ family serine protease
MKRSKVILLAAVGTIVVAGVTAFAVTKLTQKESTTTKVVEFANAGVGTHFTNYDRDNYPDLTYAAENAVKAVVNIVKTEEVQSRYGRREYNPFFEFFGIPEGYGDNSAPRERMSGGSGVIISADGYIVTNNHVVENASKLKVTLNDNRIFDGKVIGTDPTTDVALIKIDGKDLPTLAFGDSDALRLGEWVLAIGSPYDLRSTVTAGIVSAKARQLSVMPSQFGIESFILTDAAVNPGNSGGALVNVKGELMGINTVIKSPTGSYAGYSFAVPSTIVKKVIIDLREYGVVQRAMLGISYQEINDYFIERFGEEYGIKDPGGLYVAEVDPDGGAASAGIKKGDIITEIDGIKIESSASMLEQIAKHRPGDKVNISLKRGNSVKQFEVTLRNKAGKAELLKKDYVDPIDSLGGTFATITAKAAKELKISGGVQVTSIKDGGILSRARVRKGYIITHINDRAISSESDISKITEPITSIDGVYPDGRSASYSLVR